MATRNDPKDTETSDLILFMIQWGLIKANVVYMAADNLAEMEPLYWRVRDELNKRIPIPGPL